MSTSPTEISQWGWGFRALRGDIVSWDLCFRPPVVGDVEIQKDL